MQSPVEEFAQSGAFRLAAVQLALPELRIPDVSVIRRYIEVSAQDQFVCWVEVRLEVVVKFFVPVEFLVVVVGI